MSEFNTVYVRLTERLDTEDIATIEYTWNKVKNRKHILSLYGVLNDRLLITPRLAQSLTPLVTFSPTHEIVADGDALTLKVSNIIIHDKSQAENFAKALAKEIVKKLKYVTLVKKKDFPKGMPEYWKFTTKITTKFSNLVSKLPELEGIF